MIFNRYPWDQVVQAAYKKYPNPYNPNVIANDVVERRVSCGRIFTKRLLTMNWNLPYIVRKVSHSLLSASIHFTS